MIERLIPTSTHIRKRAIALRRTLRDRTLTPISTYIRKRAIALRRTLCDRTHIHSLASIALFNSRNTIAYGTLRDRTHIH
ncbi:hypothetical protein [Argonema antarcticum]|uniref:hypothetical protein n=1 Tax=Argonema antarcticum TaxID=2942763 RepID=UPI0020122348|nr:hypothetical protein [Argonema antarcticum]MCL1473782.1 hypothetical protein [Argonema antarcticum A004/B2]